MNGRITIATAFALAAFVFAEGVSAQGDVENGDFGKLGYEFQRSLNDHTRFFTSSSYEDLLSSEALTATRRKASLEAGVAWSAKSWLRLEAGIGNYYSSRLVAQDLYEVRLWQSATFDWPEIDALARWVVHHRFRLEERFLHASGWDTALRGRYRLSLAVPVNRYTIEPGAFYMPMSAEWFWNPGERDSELFTNSKSLKAGLGLQVSKDWAAEVTYTWQESRGSINSAFSRDDNVIEFKVKSTIRIRDYLKSR